MLIMRLHVFAPNITVNCVIVRLETRQQYTRACNKHERLRSHGKVLKTRRHARMQR